MSAVRETIEYLRMLQPLRPFLSAADRRTLHSLVGFERSLPFPILRIPAGKLIDHIGIPYASPAHYHRGRLAEHFARFRPDSLGAALVNAGPLAEKLAGHSRWYFANGMPWSSAERVRIVEELHRDGNCAHFGPCSAEYIAAESNRVLLAARSIAKHGYRPFRFADGFIRGFLVTNGAGYNFIVTAGKHRAAAVCDATESVLVRLEWNHFLPVVRRDDAERLPQVLAGTYSAGLAREIIDYYCAR